MKHILTLLAALLLAPLAALHAADSPIQRPNVVYLLADDLGWSDISAHPGGTIQTPHIDRLFQQGVELRNFMGWCVCSPTRAMLLTGRHPFRVGTGPETGGELAKEETTIAEGFKAHGYRTGVFGKWHNGEDPATPEFRAAMKEAFKDRPNKTVKGGLGANEHGFDEAWVYYGGGADYFTRKISGGRGPVSWWHNREYRPQDAGYTEDLITGHVLDFIRENKARPFFCYVPFHLIHAPMQAKDSDLAGVDAKVTDQTKRVYAAMVHALDKNVASILAELDKLGLRENTIVVFTSDNGATRDGSNLPLRGGKHSVFEGGTHLPTVIHWPKGKVVSGKWDGLCGALDMFPTLMAMADLKMPQTRPLDGKNIWPALRENGASPVESYYWAWRNEDAIRTADWRMHRFADHAELYDMKKDIGETTDVAKEHPDVVASLKTKMDAWADSMGAALTHLPPPA
jgi:arylsulfatase A-like enzyme